jgi:GTPase SAR1 family protein
MSLCCGGGGGADADIDPEEAKRNKELEKQQRNCESDLDSHKVQKMLLLGAGESGKSTIFKQMKVINKDGYSDKEKKTFISIIASNTITSMNAMLAAYEKLGVAMPGNVSAAKAKFDALAGDDALTPELGAILKEMWQDDSMCKTVFDRRNEFQLNDSAEYYFEAIDRISAPGYLPTTDDVLRSRVRTTGIVQSDFKIKSLNFEMFDVGGQRNERRKWIHCFDHVNVVVFVAAISEFDQTLYEDETQNRLKEALDLFKQIINSKWFKSTSVILFLNKKDLFEMKLAKLADKGRTFASHVNGLIDTEFSGAEDFKNCSKYLEKCFMAQNGNPEKSIFSHATCATDTKNVKFVFDAVVNMILEENLKASGLA